MKVLILLKTFQGGTGTFVNDLEGITHLDNTLIVKTASLERPIKPSKFYTESFVKADYYPERYVYSFSLLFTLIKELFWLRTLIKSFSPDIILTIDAHCLVLTYAESILFQEKYKIIGTIHNNLDSVISHKTPRILIGIVKWAIGYCLKNINLVVTVSLDLAENLMQIFDLKQKPKVVYYGLSQRYSGETIKEKQWNQSNEKIILSLSRLSPQKDILTVINTFHLLKTKNHKLRLWIVGDGPLKGDLQNYISNHKIRDVIFMGWINTPIEVMRKADIFVHSSNWEGFGYVLIEAMSQGLPVISTDTPFGPGEILDKNKYGVLVPMKDVDKLSRAITDILENKEKYEHFSRMSVTRSKQFPLREMQSNYYKIMKSLNLRN